MHEGNQDIHGEEFDLVNIRHFGSVLVLRFVSSQSHVPLCWLHFEMVPRQPAQSQALCKIFE